MVVLGRKRYQQCLEQGGGRPQSRAEIAKMVRERGGGLEGLFPTRAELLNGNTCKLWTGVH